MILSATQPLSEERLRASGLLPAEYEQIIARLGREPNEVELGMLGAMWSEHCGYKHSRKLLKQLPTCGPRVVQGPGENAGAVAIGDGLAVVLKMESHNHPSAVEPFQGAATGVGGILRDIFTMGARPVAILDSLRFGSVEDPRTPYLLGGVIGGVGHYGNCLAADERVVWRDADKVVHFSTIGEFVESRLEPLRSAEDLLAPGSRRVQVLSADVAADGSACWRDVRRVFKRRARGLLRLRTSLGRQLRLTPEHPVLVYEGGWWFRSAASLRIGQQVALTLSTPGEQSDPHGSIDLIEVLRARPSLAEGAWVELPDWWSPTDQVRAHLRRVEPKADRRCEYLKRRRLPWRHFLQLEEVLGVGHSELQLLRRSGRANVMKAVIQPSESFARLLGYFGSEGCVSRNGSTEIVAFTFGRYEQRYVDDVAEAVRRLGLKPRVMIRDSTIAVYVTSWLLGYLVRDVWGCGSNSLNKAVPGFVFTWPLSLQFEVLKGLFRGDGCLTSSHRNRAKISFASSSRTLFEQTLALLHNRGIVPSCHWRSGSTGNIGGRQLVWARSFHLEITRPADLQSLHGLFPDEKNDWLAGALATAKTSVRPRPGCVVHNTVGLVRITDLEREPETEDGEFVYDLEVEGTHCFVTSGGLTVHNCFGTPTVGGEISFDSGFAGNPIVNAMCVGIAPVERLIRARASGPGNVLLLVGADTGRDGLQGAAFASNEDPEASHRGVVQVGNPFLEKLLLEACLAVVGLETGDVLAMQDLGAAGLTSSAVEMAARGGLGVEIDVDRVPRRETGLTPFEVMLSESQERMLLLVRAGRQSAVQAHFARWELHAAEIGQVTSEPTIRVRDAGALVAELPIALLTDEVPAYDLTVPVAAGDRTGDAMSIGVGARHNEPSSDLNAALLRLIGSPNLRSRKFAYRQYDSTVQGNTVLGPGSAAAVVRVEGTRKGLALTTDCNPRYCRIDPRRGAAQAVAEAARNLACVGAEPIAVTDCLNFGNPEKAHVAWQLTEAVAGLAEACRALDIPIVSGNVSLYNESAGQAIPPTPTVGMVGLLEDVSLTVPTRFTPGSAIIVLGEPPKTLAASEYLASRPDPTRADDASPTHTARVPSPLPLGDGGGEEFPWFDLAAERRLGDCLRALAARRLLRSAQDVADGGLAMALAECALLGNCGATLHIDGSPDAQVMLFAEDQGRAVVTCDPARADDVVALAAEYAVPVCVVGTTGGEQLVITDAINVSLVALRRAWETEP